MNRLFSDIPVSVFERMSLAAAEHGAINLGQGFPDFGWPEDVIAAAARALKEESNQYPPSRGLPRLRQAVADHYGRHFGQQLGADHVCVTAGATEALAASLLSVIEDGDEVIVLTPAYDAYAPLVRRAGGVVREVALRPPEWRIEGEAIAAEITGRTRAIIFNNPHNPTGRLFDGEELEAVASIAREHDLTVISDEVWEHVLLGDRRFTPIGALPGMAERVLKAGSAGKIFSLTGWKVGWIVAAPEAAAVAARAHQYLTFSTPPNLQSAVAFGLEEGDSWLEPMRRGFEASRDRLAEGLRSAGYAVIPPASTYFLCVDLAESGIAMDDESFAMAAVERAGIAVVPLSAFAERDPPRNLVRLCFAKRDETIDGGIAAMAKARQLLA